MSLTIYQYMFCCLKWVTVLQTMCRVTKYSLFNLGSLVDAKAHFIQQCPSMATMTSALIIHKETDISTGSE